jgi:hypothetical protein
MGYNDSPWCLTQLETAYVVEKDYNTNYKFKLVVANSRSGMRFCAWILVLVPCSNAFGFRRFRPLALRVCCKARSQHCMTSQSV